MTIRMLLVGLLALAGCGFASAGELDAREELRIKAARLYLAESFTELDALFDEARTGAKRTDSGVWHLWILHRAVVDAEGRPMSNAQAQVQAQRAGRWVAQRPGSVTAPLVEAEIKLNYARAIACGECMVLDEASRPGQFDVTIRHANLMLDEVKAKSSVDPQWFADMVEIGRLRKWAPQQMDALLAEAKGKAPGYYTIWFNAVDYDLSRTDEGQAPQLVEATARAAVAATKDKEGASMYARVWWYAAQVRFGEHLFEAPSPVSWTEFDAGIRDVMARYPDDWNRNNFANFACNARHPERARELMQGFEPMPEAWDSFEVYVDCVQPVPEGSTLDT